MRIVTYNVSINARLPNLLRWLDETAQENFPEATIRDAGYGVVLPNGNPAPGSKFDYKLRWLDRLIAHAAELLTSRVPAVGFARRSHF